jgi:hypothetical protein
MRSRAYIPATTAVERVLVVASGALPLTDVCRELIERGAAVSVCSALPQAAQTLRTTAFDVVLVSAREDANATALFLRLVKAEALGSPRVLLLVDPAEAGRYAHSVGQADELLASTLGARRIADATGVGSEEAAAAAVANVFNLPTVYQQPTTRILALPAGISRDLLPAGVASVERGETPDAIVLTAPLADAAISTWMSAATAAVLPVIDACGAFNGRADAAVSRLNGQGLAEALDAVKPITTRVQQLPESYFRTRDPKQMLLARLAVRERRLTCKRDPGIKSIIRYPDEAAIPGVEPHAEGLSRLGLLKRRFFDKLQCCPSCTSSRLTVREECAKCRSPDIAEEPIIHHLRCGYNGPERDYRQGSLLVCPKCTHHLEHFSVDYDKPGHLTVCNDCGHTTGEPEVGFKCLDCDGGFEAARASARVFSEYELTDAGRLAAMSPPLEGLPEAEPGPDQTGSIADRIARFTASNEARGQSCAALLIKLDPEGTVAAKIGQRRFGQSISLFSSLLPEVFTQNVEIVDSGSTFLVMLHGEDAAGVEASLPTVRRELEQHLAVDLYPQYYVFKNAELRALL